MVRVLLEGRTSDEPRMGSPLFHIVGNGLSVRPSSRPLLLTCRAPLRYDAGPRCDGGSDGGTGSGRVIAINLDASVA